jgi:hypothetical protein
MATAITLGDSRRPRRHGLGAPGDVAGCRCVRGGRNRNRRVLLCPVSKSKKHRSGWAFSGPCT